MTKPTINPPNDDALANRLAWLSALRLMLLLGLLFMVATLYLRQQPSLGDFSSRLILAVAGGGLVLALAYTIALRLRWQLEKIAYAQLFFDQLSWTALVYVSGGITSGATSLFGLTALTGAVVLGVRGVVFATVCGLLAYGSLCAALLSGVLGAPPDQSFAVYAVEAKDALYSVVLNLVVSGLVASLAGFLAARLVRTSGALREATVRAEEAERLALVGRMSAALAHEIRNPLGSIAGSVELLALAPSLSEEERELCGIISREAARLNDLVSDMLALSKPRQPQLSDVDLARLLVEVTTLAARSGRGVDVLVRYDGPAQGVIISADASQLRQLIWNLVRNAVQASEAGAEVLVVLNNKDSGWLLEIIDHGQGIPSSARPHIFDAEFTTRAHGTGIGLAVVRRIADDHGWQISVESTEGHGTIFGVLIPARLAPRLLALAYFVNCRHNAPPT